MRPHQNQQPRNPRLQHRCPDVSSCVPWFCFSIPGFGFVFLLFFQGFSRWPCLAAELTHMRYCFAEQEFLVGNFSVDGFVARCRKRVPLAVMQKDLSEYLTGLKGAVVELINKDYADFVSLSSNLVGLDRAIARLAQPLESLREEVLAIKGVMDLEMRDVERALRERASVREAKVMLQRFLSIAASVSKIESLLKLSTDSEDNQEAALAATSSDGEDQGKLMERVASEYNQLHFNVSQCSDVPFVVALKPRIAAIADTLEEGLQRSFVQAITSHDLLSLKQCLRTYAIIDRVGDAEVLFRHSVVQLFMQQCISKESVQPPGKGLVEAYDRVLAFVDDSCAQLRSASASTIGGFDFVVNAVWPEVRGMPCLDQPLTRAAQSVQRCFPHFFLKNF
eukprot:m.240286 g.240286  ORF g.240286 m.240286 type:complete len:393 (+) comp22521_c0_seq6:181-1359(+)